MTANGSSSSAARPTELPTPLSPLLAAWHRGEHAELLGGLELLTDDTLPTLPAPGIDRSELATALAEANRSYGHPRADELAERLADPATRVVFTGQQPGLFGGPLYSLLKTLGAVAWAAALDEAGTPTVPLFWVATEDHDYDEVAAAHFWDREPRRLALPPDADNRRPVGSRPLGPEVESLLDEMAETWDWGSFPAARDALASAYGREATFGEAYIRYAVRILGDRAPLFVDAQLPALKKAQRPLIRALIERRAEVALAVRAAEERIEAAGFDLQVNSQPEAAPLMLVRDGARRRIVWEGEDDYSERGVEGTRSVAELLERLDEDPAAFTPNVLSRPVLQDALFGTGLEVLGAGELGYFAQAAPLYRLLGIDAPRVALRPQAIVFDPRQREQLDELGLPAELLLADEEAVDRALAERVDRPTVDPVRSAVTESLDELRRHALELDPNLERPWEKTRDQMVGALDRFSDRLVKAAAHRDGVQRRRLDGLREFASPGGALQERVLATGWYHGRFGDDFVDQIAAQLDRTPARIQILTLDPGDA